MYNYEDILKKYKTPSYLFDIDILLERVKYLKSKLGYDLVYAVKANTFIVQYLKDEVEGFELCSYGEYNIAKNLNIPYNKMVISGVNKDKKEIEDILKNHDDILKYTVESINQYNLLLELTKKYKRKINVLIRLTSGNQFGVSENDLKEIIKNNQNNLIEIKGIEYFSGTQKKSIKKISHEVDKLIEITKELEEELNFKIQEIEYGLGLPVFYFEGDEFLEDEFLDSVKIELERLPKVKISLELGRSIAASCGFYLTKVVDMKTNKYGNFVILDGGINHLVYYGGTLGMRIPHYEIYPRKVSEFVNYNLCGSLCTINDIIVKNVETRKLSLNDVFIFKNVGAYSSTEGISLFLSRDLPKVIIKKDNSLILVRDTVKTSDLNFPKEVKE